MSLVGTAGHVDHGKSALVHALTGIDPMRLAEERLREMTIDLGYAHLDLPGGHRVGFVDVPGHERLVRTMVAGATGFGTALWVVDAREGVRPQSVEHLRILELLAVPALLPVLTKTDLAAGAERDAARAGAMGLLARTGLRVLPLHEVDSLSGRGIPALREALAAHCAPSAAAAEEDAPAYLPIDRVFTLAGIGTVATGTLQRGRLAEGDRVMLSSLPGTWRIRSLHRHHRRVGEVEAGSRVGVALAGVERSLLGRGDTLLSPGYPYAGRRLNVRLRRLPGAPVRWKHGARMLLLAGCWETECRVWDCAAGGEEGWAQLELPRAVHFFPGQRFVLRAGSPLATVGGGEVLDLAPDRPRRVTPAEAAAYRDRAAGRGGVAAYLGEAPGVVFSLAALARRWMAPPARLAEAAAGAPGLRVAGEGEGARVWRTGDEPALLGRLAALAEGEGRRAEGLPYEALAPRLGVPADDLPPLVEALLDLPAAAGLRARLRAGRTGVRLEAAGSTAPAAEEELGARLLAVLQEAGPRPDRLREYAAAWRVPLARLDAAVGRLRREGRVVRVSADFALHPAAADGLRRTAAGRALDGARAAEFARAFGVTRKHAIPYLEWLAREGVLRREGDRHFLPAGGG